MSVLDIGSNMTMLDMVLNFFCYFEDLQILRNMSRPQCHCTPPSPPVSGPDAYGCLEDALAAVIADGIRLDSEREMENAMSTNSRKMMVSTSAPSSSSSSTGSKSKSTCSLSSASSCQSPSACRESSPETSRTARVPIFQNK